MLRVAVSSDTITEQRPTARPLSHAHHAPHSKHHPPFPTPLPPSPADASRPPGSVAPPHIPMKQWKAAMIPKPSSPGEDKANET
ncbi:hypothetical protein E2C01_047020 [Portunus trituberculatus]|uniref:Uncharacterized protein n=1 Tax=Portunus trituberculatus TaxID=210409 RepID=A0A5B7G6T3_PORTR|nr:hypothetical protein [Portunus trituberculatus]